MNATGKDDGADLNAAARAQPAGRIRKFTHEGKSFWVKRPEQLSLRLRLQKGDPHRSFERERRMLAALHGMGAPVPPLLAEDTNFLVLPDCGASVVHLLRNPSPEIDTAHICAAAGEALAHLHAVGATHGRPRLRDILWDGSAITLIDVEAGARLNASNRRKALDLLLFVHSFHSDVPEATAELHAAITAYRANDHGGVWDSALGLARYVRPLAWLSAPMVRRQIAHGRQRSEIMGLARLRDSFR